jgi:hypothetical protein
MLHRAASARHLAKGVKPRFQKMLQGPQAGGLGGLRIMRSIMRRPGMRVKRVRSWPSFITLASCCSRSARSPTPRQAAT